LIGVAERYPNQQELLFGFALLLKEMILGKGDVQCAIAFSHYKF
jgi:hypothetical protein